MAKWTKNGKWRKGKCPYTHAHTREWCLFKKCRKS